MPEKKEKAVEQKYQFPSETVDLPSGGKIYGKDSPLYSGKIDIKYMTAKEEDILTSQNLIKKGVVIDKVLDSLILTEGISVDDLLMGDKNAVMVAARILAYGPEYQCKITHPSTGQEVSHVFNLTECEFKKPEGGELINNSFEFELPATKAKITFKLLTGKEENLIIQEVKNIKKIGTQISPDLTTRLRHQIQSINGDDSKATINNFVENMLSRDSFALRKEVLRVSPDIDMTQEIEIEGDTVEVVIPMTVGFFWPDFQ